MFGNSCKDRLIERYEESNRLLNDKLEEARKTSCPHMGMVHYGEFPHRMIYPTCLLMSRVRELEDQNSQLKEQFKQLKDSNSQPTEE